MDLAKRLLDYGFHAPTVYFPITVKESIMVEPTETESRATLDSFAETLFRVTEEDAELLHDAAQQGGDIGDAALLRHYAALRRRDTRAVSTFTHGLIRVFANDFPPAVVARSLGLLALDTLPFAKRFLVRRTMGLAGRLPRLARGLPLG